MKRWLQPSYLSQCEIYMMHMEIIYRTRKPTLKICRIPASRRQSKRCQQTSTEGLPAVRLTEDLPAPTGVLPSSIKRGSLGRKTDPHTLPVTPETKTCHQPLEQQPADMPAPCNQRTSSDPIPSISDTKHKHLPYRQP